MAAISAFSFCCSSARLALLLARGLQFLLALLDGLGRNGRRLLRGRGRLRYRRRERCRDEACGQQQHGKRAADAGRAAAAGGVESSECPALNCIRSVRRYPYSRHRALRAMVGVAGQNGRGPVNLFKKHDADHLMRPGRRAERNAQFSLALQFGRKSVRAADHENSVGDPPRPAIGRAAGRRPRCRCSCRARPAPPARISPVSPPQSPRPLPRSGSRRRARGFPEFHESSRPRKPSLRPMSSKRSR